MKKTVTKRITLDESNPHVTLEVSAARETYFTMLARMGYPNIPTIYSLQGTNITMERIYGQSSTEYIKNYPTKEMIDIILNAVSYAIHGIISVGVFNSDTTPNNMIIDDKGNLWLIDFGVARHICECDDKKELYNISINNFKMDFAEQLTELGLNPIIPSDW